MRRVDERRSTRPLSLVEGSIPLGLIQFALPILYTSVLQSLSISINSIWIGHYLGETALAAASNANNILFLFMGATFGLALAASILVGRYIGAQDIHRVKRVVGTSTTFFTALAALIAVVGILLSKQLLMLLRTPTESLPLALSYIRAIFCSLPSQYGLAFVLSVLRGDGDSRTPFYFMLLVAIDVALNPVFIFGLGSIPALGISGSAIATLVAQTVTLAALTGYLYWNRHPLRLNSNELRMLQIDWAIVRTLVWRGAPMSGHLLIVSLNGALMIAFVNRFGADTTAAFGELLHSFGTTFRCRRSPLVWPPLLWPLRTWAHKDGIASTRLLAPESYMASHLRRSPPCSFRFFIPKRLHGSCHTARRRS